MAFTNSPLVSYTKISPFRTPNRTHAIDTVTIHCVVGQCAIETLGELFQTKECSSNYGIGYDGRTGMYVEEKDRSWCSSSAVNDHRAITIEVASDTTEPYAVRPAAYNALIKLLADICKRNGIKKLVWSTNKSDRVNHLNGCNMTCHRDYHSGKSCPGTYLYEREGQIAAEVNKLLGSADAPTDTSNALNTPQTPVYRVQIGAFSSCENAENYLATARSKGFEGFVVRGDDNLLRVQIGAFVVKQNAENYLEQAKKNGFDGFIVQSDSAVATVLPIADITVGDTVTVTAGSKTYDGGSLASFVYTTKYTVQELVRDRAVIGINGVVTAAVNVKDLTKV